MSKTEKKEKKLINTDDSVVCVGREEVGEGIVAINGDGQGLDWGW